VSYLFYRHDELEGKYFVGIISFELAVKESIYLIVDRKLLQFFNLSNNFRLAFDSWQ
jgi:hypothetical protein